MDLLRTFLTTAFSSYPIDEQSGNDRLMLKENVFVEIVKKTHFELSDDHIKLVYKLFIDYWSEGVAEPNIFYSIISFAKDVLIVDKREPCVRLEHLFKWRELTQQVGEELLVCASLAHQDLYQERKRLFNWPSVLPTDDVNIPFYYQNGLSELHQHLKASTDVFGISWLCLMNHVRGRFSDFFSICYRRDDAEKLYRHYIEAVAIRLELSRYLVNRNYQVSYDNIRKIILHAELGNLSGLEHEIMNVAGYRSNPYDYIYNFISVGLDPSDCVFSSERWFLYSVIKRIYEGDDNELTVSLMWRYVVIKNELRNKLVQNNENVGFGNFSEFETRKQVFLNKYPSYRDLLTELPIEEAHRHHHVRYVETRITPANSRCELSHNLSESEKLIEKRLSLSHIDWSNYRFIFHFIKKKDAVETNFLIPRNCNVRCEVRKQAIAIKGLLNKDYSMTKKVVGIDAANSELFCRPEIFAQAYRYLKNTGVKYTFHVGEDFYDLADGLRAISEAVRFLHIRRGDRLGHCLALGMDVGQYYKERHYVVPIPRQNLLDNLVWLYFQAKAYNVQIAPCVEMLVVETFSELSEPYRKNGLQFKMIDYYRAMALRGDNPLGMKDERYGYILDIWDAYDYDKDQKLENYRKDSVLTELFRMYHFNKEVRRKGTEVYEFKVDDAYMELISQMQDKMMDDIESKGIAIECCPSSNFKIGRLHRYDNHPIFRMNDVDPNGSHHIAVTINTDDLGIFTTSLDNEFSLILSALLKMKDKDGKPQYNSIMIQNWMEQIIRNGYKYSFRK